MAKTTISSSTGSASTRGKSAPMPASAQMVRDVLTHTLAGLNRGAIDATQARAICSCAGALLKAIQVADLELRIARLEAQAEERA